MIATQRGIGGNHARSDIQTQQPLLEQPRPLDALESTKQQAARCSFIGRQPAPSRQGFRWRLGLGKQLELLLRSRSHLGST
ncbi:hypothetical protein D3C81_1281310 [compost metagenome]